MKKFEKMNGYQKLEYLYKKYNKLIYKIANDILRDSYLAEDALSATFERTMKILYQLEGRNESECRNFLALICRNISIDMQNAYHRVEYIDNIEEAADGNYKSPEKIVLSAETLAELSEAIDRLSQRKKDIFLLKYNYELKIDDIAKTLNVSSETVKKDIRKIKDEIRKYMEGRL